MNFLVVMEFALMAILFWGAITQVIIPLWKGRPTFPMFRSVRKLEHELNVAREDVDAAQLKREIRSKQKEAEKLRPRDTR